MAPHHPICPVSRAPVLRRILFRSISRNSLARTRPQRFHCSVPAPSLSTSLAFDRCCRCMLIDAISPRARSFSFCRSRKSPRASLTQVLPKLSAKSPRSGYTHHRACRPEQQSKASFCRRVVSGRGREDLSEDVEHPSWDSVPSGNAPARAFCSAPSEWERGQTTRASATGRR